MKAKTKHIVLVTPGFPKDQEDTTCIPALQIYTRNLAQQEEVQVTVLTIHYPPIKKVYSWNNCKVYSLGVDNKKTKRIGGFFSHWKTLSKIHKENPIDNLHSFWLGECAFISHHFSIKNRVRHLTTLMGQDARKGNGFAKLLPLKKLQLISLSNFHEQLLNVNYGVKSTIIPWGVEKTSERTKEKRCDIIGIGSLIPLKKFSEFIETIQLLKKEFPEIKTAIIGDGILRQHLEEQINKANLSAHIELKGELTYGETQKVLSTSKILLHPSEYESFGMIFAEAQANGVSIVSRAVGMVNQSDNWIIGNSPSDFYKACIRLLSTENRAHAMYPKIEDTVNAYLKLYAL